MANRARICIGRHRVERMQVAATHTCTRDAHNRIGAIDEGGVWCSNNADIAGAINISSSHSSIQQLHAATDESVFFQTAGVGVGSRNTAVSSHRYRDGLLRDFFRILTLPADFDSQIGRDRNNDHEERYARDCRANPETSVCGGLGEQVTD
jgi:hypothetical protein